MIKAICKEMTLKADLLRNNNELKISASKKNIETVYLGGGTPSFLSIGLLKELFSAVHENFNIQANAEITFEANPDDITSENLEAWKSLGVNRLSIGIQSFHDADLKYLKRAHSAQKAIECINLAKDHGFNELSIDLIYGIPTLSNEQWIQNLNQFIEFSLPHLSAYALTVEPNTPLFKQIQTEKVKPVNEVQSAEQFKILMDFMGENRYLHYEISNFCKPGHFAQHNLSYWQGKEYMGFGPSSHSYNGIIRQWNVSSVTEYIKAINQNIIPSESEVLTLSNQYNEYVMTGLRTMWGCDTEYIQKNFGRDMERYFIDQSKKWLVKALMKVDGHIYTLTNEGILLADGIASDLFFL